MGEKDNVIKDNHHFPNATLFGDLIWEVGYISCEII